MSLHPSLHNLRTCFRDYARQQAPDILAFCEDALFKDHPETPIRPVSLPIVSRLEMLNGQESKATSKILAAVISAAPYLAWRQSYSSGDPGIDEEHLANYGWFDLIAPSGPFVSEDMRLSVGYWERGLSYPNHWHEPEEIYLTIAGSALYVSDGRAPVRGGPGTTICHYSNQPHSAEFDEAPLLAAAFWRGNNLEKKSVLEEKS